MVFDVTSIFIPVHKILIYKTHEYIKYVYIFIHLNFYEYQKIHNYH